jgi:hypothetical protein
MAICEWCEQEYEQSKWWQRFCCSSHKDDWHNHQKSLALREAEEDQREARLEAVNGDAGERKPLPANFLDRLRAQRDIQPKPEQPLVRRGW